MMDLYQAEITLILAVNSYKEDKAITIMSQGQIIRNSKQIVVEAIILWLCVLNLCLWWLNCKMLSHKKVKEMLMI